MVKALVGLIETTWKSEYSHVITRLIIMPIRLVTALCVPLTSHQLERKKKHQTPGQKQNVSPS